MYKRTITGILLLSTVCASGQVNLGKNLVRAGQRVSSAAARKAAQQAVSPAYFLRANRTAAAGLAGRVERQVLAQQAAASYSVQQIRQLVRRGDLSPALLASTLKLSPGADRMALLRDEFLTLSGEKQIPVSLEQAAQALESFRQDLEVRTAGLEGLKKYGSVEEMMRRLGTDPKVRWALEAVADAGAVGLYGAEEDGKRLLQFYESLRQSPLEPLALVAAVRACVNTEAYVSLELILLRAPYTQAYAHLATWLAQLELPFALPVRSGPVLPADMRPVRPVLQQISRLAALHTDSRPAISELYRSWTVKPVVRVPYTPRVLPDLKPVPPARPADEPLVQHIQDPVAAQRAEYGAVSPSGEQGYQPVILPDEKMPRTHFITHRYPSGLEEADELVTDWLEYYHSGYFHPRDQIEAIRGMSAAKANNVMEYLYYMSLEEAERVILNPIRQTGRLPDFMYESRLIPGTRRLPAGYYKNKFNENVKRLVALAQEDGSMFASNVELKDLVTSMEDYSFEQGFAYANNPQMAAGLRRNWRGIVSEVQRRGLQANRAYMNELWRKPVVLEGGQEVSLQDYFTQTSPSAFFEAGRMPEFYLNSRKWVSWENERRNLAAQEYVNQTVPQRARPWWRKVQEFFVLGKGARYLTLDQFARVMTEQYKEIYGQTGVGASAREALEDPTGGPSSCVMQVNNFSRLGGVCQAAFSDGGYMGKLETGYDGTSTVSRFTPVEFKQVPVVTFDVSSLRPQVLTLPTVPYLKDLKSPNTNTLRASIMVRDGLDPTRDLLSVHQAEAALFKLPHLKATIYPHKRLEAYQGEVPPWLNGGGLGGYLALFTPDFYPLKKVWHLQFQNGRVRWVPDYFVRKEVPALAGLIHRNRLTFTEMVADRAVEAQGGAQPSAR